MEGVICIQLPPWSLGRQISTMTIRITKRDLRKVIRESFISHTFEPAEGDHVVNNNPNCKHFGSEGLVIDVTSLRDDLGKAVTYECTNDGPQWEKGDILEKTMDQLIPARSKNENY